jgi:methyl-accepting chemotaxis protein
MIGVMTRAFALDIERVVQTFFDIQAEEQNVAFDSLNTAIDRLATGDLTYAIPGPDVSDYPLRYDGVRVRLNEATRSLKDIMSTVTQCMTALTRDIQDVSASTEDFAQRTAGQAASLEQTSTATHELAEHVSQSTANTNTATSVVTKATQTAVEGAKTMVDASEAMGRIHAASDEITNIIGMIDDIAFQTNLLALNAGVEAARAGEAGRGFAVVAQEVRGLAANASSAALQIKDLVNKSSAEVATGVALIDGAGRELQAAVDSFEQISRLTSEIATASNEQSASLKEVNTAIEQMDSVTQQNAALVEATTTATARMRNLAGKAETALDTFNIGTPEAQPAANAETSAMRVA